MDIASTKIDALVERKLSNESLSPEEEASYLIQAMNRQAKQDDGTNDQPIIAVDEVKAIATSLLSAWIPRRAN